MYGFWFALHVACVWLSLAGFVLRGVWMLTDSPRRTSKPARILPHVVDTLLLVSALALCALLGSWPFVQGWLTAKVVALVAYIGLGVVAFRLGRTLAIRAGAFAAALGAFAYMLAVSHAHDPWPF
jgi:uncharacterized membrane protein SirB2